jgi:hypothetical protein
MDCHIDFSAAMLDTEKTLVTSVSEKSLRFAQHKLKK